MGQHLIFLTYQHWLGVCYHLLTYYVNLYLITLLMMTLNSITQDNLSKSVPECIYWS